MSLQDLALEAEINRAFAAYASATPANRRYCYERYQSLVKGRLCA